MKTFQGSSMADTLAQVKRDLGPEAVILHTRTFRRGGVLGVGARQVVEITASRDPAHLTPTERPVIIGRGRGQTVRGRPERVAGGDTGRTLDTEGAAVTGTVPSPPPPAEADFGRFSRVLTRDMGSLRAMVRELLDRAGPSGRLGSGDGLAPSCESAAPPLPDIPDDLEAYYTLLIGNAVADEIAREVIAAADERLEAARQEIRSRLAGRRAAPDGSATPDSSLSASRTFSETDALREIIPAVLTECLERMLPPAEPVELDADGATKFVALVGPTGVGKTTTIAKLAAHFKLREGKRVGLVTIDTYRIAAVDQLRTYADILHVPLETVLTPEEMTDVVGRMRDLDLVLIDTSGRSQKDARRLSELRDFLEAVRAGAGGEAGALETHLVLSCTAHPRQLSEVAERFGQLGVDRVVFTKLDEAVGFGAVLEVIRKLDLHLSYLTTGQDVPEDIEVGHRRRIAELILAPEPTEAEVAKARSPGGLTAVDQRA